MSRPEEALDVSVGGKGSYLSLDGEVSCTRKRWAELCMRAIAIGSSDLSRQQNKRRTYPSTTESYAWKQMRWSRGASRAATVVRVLLEHGVLLYVLE
ncbi:hypothetical protein B296_00031349 [Ensete ventricosum]|uniref:Uncharacterized protein n=1 Tax=Ensete ventricosum TaxID=4639 RepID=A0A427AGN6_ENSVE|nr:hypothetical protein B296_00031349 [Ensete ventricosum]